MAENSGIGWTDHMMNFWWGCNKPTVDKLTSTGRDIRDFDCPACGWGDSEDRGPALWTMMSADSNDDATDSDTTNAEQKDQDS